MDKRTKGLVAVGVLVIIAMIAVIIGIVGRKIGNIAGDENGRSTKSDMTLDELYADIDVSEATPVKGTVTLDTPDLYEELPEIDKYPLAVEGNGDIDIEIFTSGEKAGKDNDSWLIDVANSFNGSGAKTADEICEEDGVTMSERMKEELQKMVPLSNIYLNEVV